MAFRSEPVAGDDVPPNQGLFFSLDLLVSPGDRHLYIPDATISGGAVSLYGIGWILNDDFESGDLSRWSDSSP